MTMRVLLDESVPKALGFAVEGHFVRTVQAAGFAGLFNGQLMAAMKNAGYEALITFDQNLAFQQNKNLPVAVIVLVARNNRVETAVLFASAIANALRSVKPGQLIELKLE